MQTLRQTLALLTETSEARALRHEIERVGGDSNDEEQRSDSERDHLRHTERARAPRLAQRREPRARLRAFTRRGQLFFGDRSRLHLGATFVACVFDVVATRVGVAFSSSLMLAPARGV